MAGRTCRQHLADSPWPNRTPALVERDRDAYSGAVANVLDEHLDDGYIEDGGEPGQADRPALDDERLVAMLGDAESTIRRASAAFVAGRCTTEDADGDAAIAAALRDTVESIDTSKRLGPNAHVYVEAVMSTALLGDVDDATARFEAMFANPDHRSVADHLAAGYLAQIGSPAGWAFLVDDLHDRDSDHVRMLAVEQLLAFVPYQGKDVDVVAELQRALRDKDEDIAIAAIGVLLDADLPGRDELLSAATKKPHHKDVRRAAEAAIKDLRSS